MSIIKVENLGKKYTIGHDLNAGGAYRSRSLRDALTHTARRLLPTPAPSPVAKHRKHRNRGAMGPQESRLRSRARRSGWHHRPQRRRQVNPPQGPQSNHRTDDRPYRDQRPCRFSFRGWNRISPRTQRAREYIPQRGHPRYDPELRSRRSLMRSSIFRRSKNSSTRRSNAIPRECTCASPSPLRRIWNRRS